MIYIVSVRKRAKMDPTIPLIQISSSFDRKPKSPTALPVAYRMKHKSRPKTKITMTSKSPKPVYVDVDSYGRLNYRRDRMGIYDKQTFIKARNKANPYEEIGRSSLINRAGVKLANISAVYGLLHDVKKAIDVAGAPGGFVSYIHHALPEAHVDTISLSEKSGGLPWWTDRLDQERLTIHSGQDGTGNLYTNWESFMDTDKYDFYSADGGIETKDFSAEEHISSRLVHIEIFLAIYMLVEGGNAVIKVFDTVNKVTADVLLIASQCFKSMSIFKPLSSRPANKEKYIILEGRLSGSEIGDWPKVLFVALKKYTDDKYLKSIFEDLPEDFEAWLRESNNYGVEQQSIYVEEILAELGYKNTAHNDQIKPVDCQKALLLWDIPSSKFVSDR